jgi:hypothetical protein
LAVTVFIRYDLVSYQTALLKHTSPGLTEITAS